MGRQSYMLLLSVSQRQRRRQALRQFTTIRDSTADWLRQSLPRRLIRTWLMAPLSSYRADADRFEMSQKMNFGNMPNDDGNLLLSGDEASELRQSDPVAASFLRRLIGARPYLHGTPRWCLWVDEHADPAVVRSSSNSVHAQTEYVNTGRDPTGLRPMLWQHIRSVLRKCGSPVHGICSYLAILPKIDDMCQWPSLALKI